MAHGQGFQDASVAPSQSDSATAATAMPAGEGGEAAAEGAVSWAEYSYHDNVLVNRIQLLTNLLLVAVSWAE